MPFSVFEDCEEIFAVQGCSGLMYWLGVLSRAEPLGELQLVCASVFLVDFSRKSKRIISIFELYLRCNSLSSTFRALLLVLNVYILYSAIHL